MRKLILAIALTVVMILPQTAFAQMNVDVSHGDVTIDNTHVTYYDSNGKQVRAAHQGAVTVTQSDAKNTGDIVVTAAKPVSITLDQLRAAMLLDGAQITAEEAAPIAVVGGSEVSIELDGTNVLTGGEHHAALEVDVDSGVTILDGNRDGGTLEATGGKYGAGIGGAYKCDSGKITIAGGEVTATAGWRSAGIGGGRMGDGSYITITGGKVIATGDNHGAGIGGGEKGMGSNIMISGGTVEAYSGDDGAGIGGGSGGSGIGIYVIGGNVKAVSSHSGAGIGGGHKGDGQDIFIEGGIVQAAGGDMGAGIGGGWTGKAKNISISGDAVVTAEGKEKAANVGNGAEYNGGQMTDNVDISKLSTFGSYNKNPGKAEPAQSIPLVPEPTATEEAGE